MTNFEKIKNMSIEEIADKLDGLVSSCECCPVEVFCRKNKKIIACKTVWKNWLKREDYDYPIITKMAPTISICNEVK